MSQPLFPHRESILHAECVRETLVVTPAGDLVGYSPDEFRRDLALVRRRLRDPAVRNVVINLGRAEYFGAEMISALRSLQIDLGDRGRLHFADASPMMEEALQRLELNVGATAVHSTAATLSDVNHSQMSGTFYAGRDTYRRSRPLFPWLLAALALMAGCFAFSRWRAVSALQTDLQQLEQLWIETRRRRGAEIERSSQREGLERFLRNTLHSVGAIHDRYRDLPGRTPAQESLLRAAAAMQSDLTTVTGSAPISARVEQALRDALAAVSAEDPG